MNSLQFKSRRSPVLSTRGCVSCNIPIASKIGIDILHAGGNAADAAVAMAAALAVAEPQASGLGGDCFSLFYRKSDQKVLGLNGNGQSPAKLTLDMVKSAVGDCNQLPLNHGLSVVVPGAVGGWIDTVTNFGSGQLSLQHILAPAIKLAEEGFPVTPVVAFDWNLNSSRLKQSQFGKDLLVNGEAPKAGDIMKIPLMAQTLKEIASHGKEGFYSGYIAKRIAEEVQFAGGCLSTEDLENHLKQEAALVQPISTNFHGVRLWEIPPVGQGLIALLTLNILDGFDLKGMEHNSAEYLHILAESIRLAFMDGHQFIADHKMSELALHQLLDKNYAKKRAALIKPERVMPTAKHGNLFDCKSDTTYLSVVDEEGNACSFICSVYYSFGSGIVPEGCGFSLHNRGLNFSLKSDHPNVVGPSKFPYHTIIPAVLTDADTDCLLASFGVMGQFMQPQGQVQVLLNMLLFGMDPQTALDQPRLYVDIPNYQRTPYSICLEEGISETVKSTLKSWGHTVKGPICSFERKIFGRGHVITPGSWWRDWSNHSSFSDSNVLWAGCDPRTDGLSLGY